MKKETIQNIQAALTRWYRQSNRDLPWRESNTPYRVWVSEVMLQQTRIETTIPYYKRFIEKFPDVNLLAESDLQSVLKLWEGLGYYARARNMHKAAKVICEKYQGRLPDTREELLQLPGIGDYISAAVASISFHIPVAVVDGNVKRILSRFFMDSAPINDTRNKKHYEGRAGKLIHPEQPGDFNQAIMELGQRICKPKNPSCMDCPIQKWCEAFQKNRTLSYPKQILKKAIPLKNMIYAIIFQGEKCLILRRPTKGLLGGLWEFPGGELHKKEKLSDMVFRQTGIQVTVDQKIGTVNHAYTHFKVTAEVYLCAASSQRIRFPEPMKHQWILPQEIHEYPCHKLIHKMFPMLHELSNRIKS